MILHTDGRRPTPQRTPEVLLARCRAMGIRLAVEPGGLRVEAEQGVLDSALRAELIANKPALIALLTPAASEAAADPEPKADDGIHPRLTRAYLDANGTWSKAANGDRIWTDDDDRCPLRFE